MEKYEHMKMGVDAICIVFMTYVWCDIEKLIIEKVITLVYK